MLQLWGLCCRCCCRRCSPVVAAAPDADPVVAPVAASVAVSVADPIADPVAASLLRAPWTFAVFDSLGMAFRRGRQLIRVSRSIGSPPRHTPGRCLGAWRPDQSTKGLPTP